MHNIYNLERIIKEFARLTGKDLPSATGQIEDILDYLLFNHPHDSRPGSEDHFRLSGTYERLAEYNRKTVNEDEQLARYFRIATSIGSHIVSKGLWIELERLRGIENGSLQEIPAKVLRAYLSAKHSHKNDIV